MTMLRVDEVIFWMADEGRLGRKSNCRLLRL